MSASIPARTVGIGAAVIVGAAFGCRFFGDEQAVMSAVRLLTATLAVGVVPGALTTMLVRPRAQLMALEIIGFGIAISFGFVQLAAIVAVFAHLGATLILFVLAAGTTLMAVHLVRRPSVGIVMTLDESVVIVLLVALGVFLYNLGSPVVWYEDQVHIAIVRRLSELVSPRLDNLYVAPGIVYTYPVPGTHYFMALVAKLSDVDPLFVYHKLRFFWGPAALVMLHLAARAVFGAGGLSSAVTVTAIALVCNGTFAMVPGFASGWGQLVPYSHASDVAMTVLLPALLVVAFGYLQGTSRREHTFFLAATVMLLLMLAMVHIREVVQFVAYLVCFLVVTVGFPRFRPYAYRTATLLAVAIGIAAVYTLWQAEVAGLVSDIVQTQRARLTSVLTTSSLRTLVATSAPALLGDFLVNSDQTTRGLIPLFLIAGPAVLLLLSQRPLAWLMCASTAVYLAVMAVPLLAILYIYFTYFEILYTPVRNVIFFVYLYAGAALYMIVLALAQIDRTRLSLLATGILAGVLALLVTLCLNRSTGGFIAPAIAAYGLAFLFLWAPASARTKGIRNIAAALLVVLGLVALLPEREPPQRITQVSVRWAAPLSAQDRAALERRFSLASGEPHSNYSEEVNVWNYQLTDLSQENVRALVTHPQVVDTNAIDRSAFTVPLQPPANDHQYLGVEHVTWLQYPGLFLFLLTAACVWTLGFVLPAVLASSRGSHAVALIHSAVDGPFYKRIVPYALFIIPFAIVTARPTLSPLTAEPTLPAGPDTPDAVISRIPCATTPSGSVPSSRGSAVPPPRTTCPPDRGVMEWVRTHVPTDAVFAVDRWMAYAPQMFMPQQAVAFPAIEATFLNEDQLFQDYDRFFDDRMQRYGVQPFFNSVETSAERTAFIEGLGVTHVLINPSYYAELRAVLDRLPDQFTPRYDQDGWAVYEVIRTRRTARGRS